MVTLHCSSSQPQASSLVFLPSVPVSLTSLDTSSEYNYAIFVLLWLAYFTLHSVLQFHPCCNAYHNVLPFFLKAYLFYFGCGGSLLLCGGFSLQEKWLLLLRSTDARREGFHSCGTEASRYIGSSQTRDQTRVPCIDRQILFFLINLFFNWRIIALQNCVGFCQASPWISHRYTCVSSLLNLPPTSHPIPPL